MDFLIPDRTRIKQYADHCEFKAKVLDVGTGSGVLAKLALEKNASHVTAVDINPAAVAHARRWLANNPSATVFESDLFSNVLGTYDTILFAAPWSEGEIRAPLDFALYDLGVVPRFLSEVRNYLEDDGLIYLQYCDAFPENLKRVEASLEANGLVTIDRWAYSTWGRLVNREVNVILFKIAVKSTERVS